MRDQGAQNAWGLVLYARWRVRTQPGARSASDVRNQRCAETRVVRELWNPRGNPSGNVRLGLARVCAQGDLKRASDAQNSIEVHAG
jgi:hypothetical protein